MNTTRRGSVKLFDARAIAVATLFSPLAGGTLWAFNDVRVGRSGQGSACFAIGAGLTGLLYAAHVSGMPSPVAALLLVVLAFGARFGARNWHKRAIADGLVTKPTFYSFWLVVVAMLVLSALVVGGGLYYVELPREGAPCHGPHTVVCDGPQAAWWCDEHETYRHMPCHGADGCASREPCRATARRRSSVTKERRR
jgi:hypothetical protein